MTSRPFKLSMTADGGISGEHYGTFASPEAAWRKADGLVTFWRAKRWTHLYRGMYLIVTAPGYRTEALPIHEADEGQPLAFAPDVPLRAVDPVRSPQEAPGRDDPPSPTATIPDPGTSDTRPDITS